MPAPRAFRFRLQKLKNAREIREQQEQSKLLALQAEMHRQQAELEAMLERERQTIAEMTAPQGGKFDPEARLARERWLVTYRQQIDVQRDKVAQAHVAVMQQENVLKAARQDVKVLEKLEEKQREEWQEELLRDQAIFLDDLSGQGYIRQSRERARRLAAEQEIQG